MTVHSNVNSQSRVGATAASSSASSSNGGAAARAAAYGVAVATSMQNMLVVNKQISQTTGDENSRKYVEQAISKIVAAGGSNAADMDATVKEIEKDVGAGGGSELTNFLNGEDTYLQGREAYESGLKSRISSDQQTASSDNKTATALGIAAVVAAVSSWWLFGAGLIAAAALGAAAFAMHEKAKAASDDASTAGGELTADQLSTIASVQDAGNSTSAAATAKITTNKLLLSQVQGDETTCVDATKNLNNFGFTAPV